MTTFGACSFAGDKLRPEYARCDMAEGPSFVCGTCGKIHEGLVKDMGFALPEDVWSIPAPERKTRAVFDTDLCRFGERHFIRCLLRIPFVGRTDYFGWGVWVEVDRHDFDRYVEFYQKDGSAEPLVIGRLANRIPCYPDAAGEVVRIKFGVAGIRPDVLVDVGSETSLGLDHNRGINDARHHQILADLGQTTKG